MISMRYLVLAAGLLAAPAALACPTHAVPLAPPAADGPPKEVKELLDTPFVKLVSITLRNGTVLPDHAAPVAVTLQAIAGAGSVKVGEEVTPLSAGQMMLIAPQAVHSVTPTGDAPLVVLVHYLKGGAAGPHGGHHGAGADHAGGHGGCAHCKDGEGKDGKEGTCPHCKDGQCKDGACAGHHGPGDGPCKACQDGKCPHCKDGACKACKDGNCPHCKDGQCKDGACAGHHGDGHPHGDAPCPGHDGPCDHAKPAQP